jgi:hypothetical protein
MPKRNYGWVFLLSLVAFSAAPGLCEQWYKGALHVHSLRSDGDAAPEVPVSWYKEHGWNFVCVTEHNQMQNRERFRDITENSGPTPEHVAMLKDKFGATWVEQVEEKGKSRLRLKTFAELETRFNETGSFLLIHGEEITSLMSGPHVNGLNIEEEIPAKAKAEAVPAARAYAEAVAEQEAKMGRPMLTILNHPNFAEAVTLEEMLQLPDYRFFEVFNGHPSVNNWGHERKGYPSTDQYWDAVLTMRLVKGQNNPLYGVASDDAHNYFNFGTGEANPGRGWVMVSASTLDAAVLMDAMKAGNFYASTGVILDSILREDTGLSFKIKEERGVAYTTKFIGSKKGCSTESHEYKDPNGEIPERASRVYRDEIGEVLAESKNTAPAYRFSGNELYVRAIVISDKPHPNPFREGDLEMAWVQPVPAN